MNNNAYWKHDLKASLVVFLVALPLCLGIALASNAPLSAGLLAGIIGGVVVGFLSDSRISVSGPAAGLTVIVAAAIADLGSFNAFTLSVMFAGIIQVIFGLTKGGTLGNFFPASVIKGMLAAIGLILILKQFPHAIGYNADFMGDESFQQIDGENTFSEIMLSMKAAHTGSIIIALISFFIILGWEKLAQKGKALFQLIPAPLIAVVVTVFVNQFFNLNSPLVELPFKGGLGEFFGSFTLPDWSHLSNPKVYSTAFVIAIVASIESLLSIEAADKIDQSGHVASKNKELFAQGMGNTLAGLIGALPVTAVIVRSSANATAGAKSKLSAIVHGLWLFGCVVTIPHILNLIPLSCLAVVLILVGYKLTKPELIKKMYQKGWNQFIPFAGTIVAILFTDLLVGIIIGMVIGFAFVIKSSFHKSIVMVQEEKEFLIRFHKDVSFLHKATLLGLFGRIPQEASVVIDGSLSVYVDDDIIEVIEDFMKRANNNNISVELKKSSTALSQFFKEVQYG
jgi:MFS superfamily sulfate permease-like transporter